MDYWLFFDFRIHKNYVFFCGKDTSDTVHVGYFSAFPLSAFFASNIVQFRVSVLLKDIKVVDKLMVYDLGVYGKSHVVALGSMTSPLTSSWFSDYLIECDYDFATDAYVGVQSRHHDHFLPTPSSTIYEPRQYLYDIIETDTNVILLSAPNNHLNMGLYYRRCSKGNVTGLQSNIIYHYYTATEPAFQGIAGISIEQGYFATVSSQWDLSDWAMNMRIFEISSMNNTVCQQIPLEDKTRPGEIQYSKTLNQLFVIQNHNYFTYYNTDHDIVCFSLSKTIPYNVPILYHPYPSRYQSFMSLDMMTPTALIVGNFFDAAWWYKDFLYSTTTTSCYSTVKEVATFPSKLSLTVLVDTMTHDNHATRSNPAFLFPNSTQISTNCIKQK